jgi:hypothetical protein
MDIAVGADAIANGLPAIGVSAPVAGLISNA